jgi:alkylhydroperoxidase family enzyme
MAQKTLKPDPRLAPLPLSAELSDLAPNFAKSLGFVPNSVLIMQRKPKLVRAFTALTAAVWDPESEVDRGFKRLVAHVASRAHGCHY